MSHEVYSFGMVSSSTLYKIHSSFPAPQGYAEIESKHYMTGGEAANSSIVLARLGVRVKLDGNWIGTDEGGQRTMALLQSYEVDTTRLSPKPGYVGASEVVFAARDTRTIFGTYGRLHDNGEWNSPHSEDIAQAKVVCLDPFFGDASIRVSQLAQRSGIPVVTVDCKFDDPLVDDASAVVVAESYLQENYPGEEADELFASYRSRCSGLVVFTFGAGGAWYSGGKASRTSLPGFPVTAVDTTGAGDAFRAGIAFGVLRDWGHDRTVRFAAGVAAIVCCRFPGVLDAPTYDEVAEFMAGGA